MADAAPEAENLKGSWSREEERALVRKLDARILPMASLMFLIAYLDRGNIGNARVANIGTPQGFEAELGLNGNDFQTCVSIFFVTYIIFETPSNMVIKYFTPRIWLARIMFTWGIVSGCQAACSNMAGIMVCRLLLGLAEAGLLPGLLLWIGFWYRKFEIALRTSIIHSSLAIAGAFSGLLATGIAQMNGSAGLSAWRWIFIIEAIPPLVLAVLVWVFLPDFPHTAKKFLTERERTIAIARLPPSAPSHLHKNFDREQFMGVLRDPMNIVYPVVFAIAVVPQLGLSYFLPSILKGMGFTGTMSNLMSVWPNMWAGLFEIYMGWNGDRKQERYYHAMIPMAISVFGFILLSQSGKNGWPVGAGYFITFLVSSGIASAPAWFSWRQNMISGATETAVVMAWTNTVVNIAGAVAPFVFPTNYGPYYEYSCYACIACWVVGMSGLTFIRWFDARRRSQGFYDAAEQAAKEDLERMEALYLAAEKAAA